MGISRSAYYDAPTVAPDDTAIVEAMSAIRDEFERYGWRRMQAAPSPARPRGQSQEGQAPHARTRSPATHASAICGDDDSDHDHPIFRNLAKDMIVNGANQLWVADITYVAVAVGFVYVAVILDAWSRRVVGYAISRSDRCPADARRSERRNRGPQTAGRLPSSLG